MKTDLPLSDNGIQATLSEVVPIRPNVPVDEPEPEAGGGRFYKAIVDTRTNRVLITLRGTHHTLQAALRSVTNATYETAKRWMPVDMTTGVADHGIQVRVLRMGEPNAVYASGIFVRARLQLFHWMLGMECHQGTVKVEPRFVWLDDGQACTLTEWSRGEVA